MSWARAKLSMIKGEVNEWMALSEVKVRCKCVHLNSEWWVRSYRSPLAMQRRVDFILIELDFKQGPDMIWFMLLKHHSGCWIKNGLFGVRREGGRLKEGVRWRLLRVGHHRDGEKYSDSGEILEVEPSEFIDELNRGGRVRWKLGKLKSRVCGLLSSWKLSFFCWGEEYTIRLNLVTLNAKHFWISWIEWR